MLSISIANFSKSDFHPYVSDLYSPNGSARRQTLTKMYYNISHLFLKNNIRHICYGAAIGGTERKRNRQCTYERDF